MHRGRMSRLLSAALIVSVPVSGFAKPPRWEKSASVKWADDAGSVTVAPISVIPWEEAAPLLQPKFTMTPDMALTQAIPTSQSEDVRLAYILNAAMKLALPTTATTVTETQKGSTNDDLFPIERQRTKVTSRGSIEGLDDPELAGRTADALGGLTTGPSAFDRDPMLRHLAAMALFQEVHLLNRYVTDAVRYRGAQAFLVRLQLSVLPSQRGLPYDVTTDVTIHPQDMMAHARLAQEAPGDAEKLKAAAWVGNDAALQEDTARAEKVATELTDRKNAALGRAWKSLGFAGDFPAGEPAQGADARWKAAYNRIKTIYEKPADTESAHRRCSGRWDSVNIVPMVVTDNMEGIAASRSTDSATQLGLALMGTIANIGLGGNFSETKEAIRRAQGRDTNSLLTVARLTDDTVRIRLGAAQSPSLGNTMLPRTHNISLVVIYRPCDKDAILENGEERMLTAVTKANFTDVFTGKTLPYQQGADRLIAMTSALNRKYNNRFSYLEYAHLFRLVSQQDRESYWDFFNKKFRLSKHSADPAKPNNQCPGLSYDFGTRRKLGFRLKHGSRVKDIEPRKEDNDFLNYLYEEEKEGGESNDCLREVLAYDVAPNALWTDLQSVRAFGEYSYANIPVVLRKIAPALPPHDQRVLITYAESGAAATLVQGRDLSRTRDLTAELVLAKRGSTADGTDAIKVLATEVKPSSDGRSVSLKFPSYKAFYEQPKDKDAPQPYEPARILLSGKRLDDGQALTWKVSKDVVSEEPIRYESLFVTAKAPEAAAALSYALAAPAAGILVGPDGKGQLAVHVQLLDPTKKAKNLRLMVKGAQVVSMSGSASAEDFGWKINSAGRYTLALESLLPGQEVELSLVEFTPPQLIDEDNPAAGFKPHKEAPVAQSIKKLVYARMVAGKE
ncbi:MAG TPA: hypothetical protein VGB70_01450 [Allosphingosinicella sp.]